jgi:hypothetical protein
LIVAGFVGGFFVTHVICASMLMNALGEVDIGHDATFTGAACLLCSLVGLLTAMMAGRLARLLQTPNDDEQSV